MLVLTAAICSPLFAQISVLAEKNSGVVTPSDEAAAGVEMTGVGVGDRKAATYDNGFQVNV